MLTRFLRNKHNIDLWHYIRGLQHLPEDPYADSSEDSDEDHEEEGSEESDQDGDLNNDSEMDVEDQKPSEASKETFGNEDHELLTIRSRWRSK